MFKYKWCKFIYFQTLLSGGYSGNVSFCNSGETNGSPLQISLLSNWFWAGCYQPGAGQAKPCSVRPPRVSAVPSVRSCDECSHQGLHWLQLSGVWSMCDMSYSHTAGTLDLSFYFVNSPTSSTCFLHRMHERMVCGQSVSLCCSSC